MSEDFINKNKKMDNFFDKNKYVELVLSKIRERAEKTKGKLYIDINGKLLKDDFAERIFPWYESDLKKKIIIALRHEVEILVCVNASVIIENTPMTKKWTPGVQHIDFTLKRIETVTGIKPNLVITNINPEDMYDVIYNFEKTFQKKWCKVWENYLKRWFPFNKSYLLSENGFWNDDHIPIMKKIALITWIWEESWKFATAVWQIYQDHWIGLESSYCMFQTLPLSEVDSENPINQAWAKRRDNESLALDDFWETIEESSQDNLNTLNDLLWDVIEKDNLIKSYEKTSDMIICPTFECIKNMEEVEKLAKKEMEK